MNSRNFFVELKRRNVYKVAVAYAIVAWLLIQGASILFPTFEAPAWVMKVFVTAIIFGFPVALIFAWAFEITPEGIKRAEDVAPNESITARTGRKLVGVTIVLAVIAAGLLALQFLRPKSTAAPATTLAPVAAAAASAIPEKSIAVLPFENLSEEKANAFFTDGVQDEILTDLARIADLKVISRTSVMQYKSGAARNLREIGQQLGVAHLLEGSVQRASNRIRVNAQLIDARTDAHLWAQTYDRDLADVFAIQSEVAQAIADQLRAKLSPAEKAAIEERPTADLVAYDLYVRANALIDEAFSDFNPKEMALEGVSLLDQAVARDPAFLLAYCKLAYAHDQFYLQGLDHTASRLALAETAVNAALRLGPDSGDAHLALAQHLYSNLDYDRARPELAIARRTLPNNPQVFALSGYVDRRQGRWVESARNLERALELDPRNVITLQQVAFSYAALRAYPEEIAAWNRILGLKPGDFGARLGLAFVDFAWRADTRRLRALIEALAAENPASMGGPLGGIRFYVALLDRDSAAAERAVTTMGDSMLIGSALQVSRAFLQGALAQMKGDAPAARAAFTAARATQEQIVRAQPDYGPTLCVLGLIDANLGRKDDALREGRRAMEVMPVAKDSLNGPDMISFFAVICAWTGEKDLAFQQLATAAQIPGGVVYGDLKLNPQWDPLRGDPRFDKIVASLAPKEITSK